MKIELGHLPDPNLNPNKRLHWAGLYRAKRDAKQEACLRVVEQGRPHQPLESALLEITWVAKSKRRRDADNLFASMKPYIDGLVMAGVLVDDSADRVQYELRYERGDVDNTIINVLPSK